jgi:glycosyl transferase family 25
MEDDVRPTSGFRDAALLAGQVLRHHHFVRLYGLRRRRSTMVRSLGNGYFLVRYLRGPSGTQCYAISPTGAAALIRGAATWREPVDRYIDRFWDHRLTSMAILPFQLGGAGRDAFPSAVESWARTGRASLSSRAIRAVDHLRRHAYNFRRRLQA